MVNLVLISRSTSLAEATRQLALRLATGGIRIALAAGCGGSAQAGGRHLPEVMCAINDVKDPREPDSGTQSLGTDPLGIASAIRDVHGADGVILLTDSEGAEPDVAAALARLPAELRRGVVLSAAPFVEGAVAVATRAGTGKDLAELLAIAERSLSAKEAALLGRALPASARTRRPPRGARVAVAEKN